MKKLRLLPAVCFVLLLSAVACTSSQDGTNGGDVSHNEDLKNLPRTPFDIGKVSFSLAEFPTLTQVHRDSVAWTSYLPQTEENAPITYYFMDMKRTLSAPHIRIEYIDKKLDLMGSTESIFGWLKGLYINPQQNGKVLEEGSTLTTMDGQEVELLAIERPNVTVNDSLSRGLKIMAWAYVDHGDRFVALNFSTTDRNEYEEGLPFFKDLVRSYQDE